MLTLSAFLGAGGVHGVVVGKSYQPLPLVDSLGMGGIYRIELRAPDRTVHRQLVSREIFEAYQIGDAFDDRLPAEAARKRQEPQSSAEEKLATTLHRDDKMKAAAITQPAGAKTAQTKQPAVAKITEVKQLAVEKTADPNPKVAAVFQKHDMLPETEGF